MFLRTSVFFFSMSFMARLSMTIVTVLLTHARTGLQRVEHTGESIREPRNLPKLEPNATLAGMADGQTARTNVTRLGRGRGRRRKEAPWLQFHALHARHGNLAQLFPVGRFHGDGANIPARPGAGRMARARVRTATRGSAAHGRYTHHCCASTAAPGVLAGCHSLCRELRQPNVPLHAGFPLWLGLALCAFGTLGAPFGAALGAFRRLGRAAPFDRAGGGGEL